MPAKTSGYTSNREAKQARSRQRSGSSFSQRTLRVWENMVLGSAHKNKTSRSCGNRKGEGE